MKAKITMWLIIILFICGIFAVGYRMAEMKYTDQSIMTVYQQD